jgi:hypothetical protein
VEPQPQPQPQPGSAPAPASASAAAWPQPQQPVGESSEEEEAARLEADEPTTLRKQPLLLGLTCISCLFFTGPVFGFGALQAVMERDGEYAYLCAGAVATNLTTAAGRGRVCPEQENALAVLYTVGGTMVPFMSLPAGLLLDMAGPAHSTSIAGLLVVGGLLTFGLSSASCGGGSMSCGSHASSAAAVVDGVDLFTLGFALMGCGGIITFFAAFPTSYFFGELQGCVTASLDPLEHDD